MAAYGIILTKEQDRKEKSTQTPFSRKAKHERKKSNLLQKQILKHSGSDFNFRSDVVLHHTENENQTPNCKFVFLISATDWTKA